MITLAFPSKLIKESVEPGYILLHTTTEGPTGSTYKLAFAVELFIDQSDIDEASADLGISPTEAEEEKKFSGIHSLIDGLKDPAQRDNIVQRLRKYGIYDLVSKITKGEFRDLLRYLRSANDTETMLAIKRPKYWTSINPDPMRGDVGKEFTDLRAGKGGRGTDTFKQKALKPIWDHLINKNANVIKDQVKLLFANVSDAWQSVIFGQNDANIIIQNYKGSEQYGDEEQYDKESSEYTGGRPDVDIGGSSARSYDLSWHYQYGKKHDAQGRSVTAKQSGESAPLWEQNRLLKMAKLLNSLRTTRKWQSKIKSNPQFAKQIDNKLKSIHKQIDDYKDRLKDKKVVYAWVYIDMEQFIETIGNEFEAHLERQETDENYATSTKSGEKFEVWPSGLTGYKQFIYNMIYLSRDTNLKDDLIEILNVGVGTLERYKTEAGQNIDTGTIVVDIDNGGNIIYQMVNGSNNDKLYGSDEEGGVPLANKLSKIDQDIFGKPKQETDERTRKLKQLGKDMTDIAKKIKLD